MNTIYTILKQSAVPGADGSFDDLVIGTKGGDKISGTLLKWNPEKSSHIAVVFRENVLSYIEIDCIESVTITNPARR